MNRIKPGGSLPVVNVKYVSHDLADDRSTREIFAGKRSVMFTVLGAFTPVCNRAHLPGFLKLADQILAKDIDQIICATVNDHHVVQAWAKASESGSKVQFIADFDAKFAQALGLVQDLNETGLGFRFVRSALIVNDLRVSKLFLEEKPGDSEAGSAQSVLAAL